MYRAQDIYDVRGLLEILPVLPASRIDFRRPGVWMLLLGVLLKLMEVPNIRTATLFAAPFLLVEMLAGLADNSPPDNITPTQRASWLVVCI